MDSVNEVFYIVTDKIIELQEFFLRVTNTIARIVLLVAILTAAVNYALTGTGLKENIIKIGKAFVFFSIVVFFYPRIISWITDVTFSLARQSTYDGRLSNAIQANIYDMRSTAETKRANNNNWTASAWILTEPKYNESSSHNVLRNFLNNRVVEINGKTYSYSTVAPAAALDSVFLIASDIFKSAERFDWKHPFAVFGALICGFFTIIVGCFCLLEYLIAYLEFMFVSSVGIILFPMSLWDGTKFIAEKFIGAMLGFFVKLLFSTICIFLMLYAYVTIALTYVKAPFVGEVVQIIPLFLTSLLVFYLCKSAPALAQGLLSGSPSLTGAGAIGTVASAVMATARLSGMAGGSPAQGAATPQIPPAQAAAISGGSNIASITPPPFSTPQAFAFSGFIPSPPPQRAAIEDRSDLTRSIAYNARPLIGGPSIGTAAMLPEPNKGNARNQDADYGPEVDYEVLGSD
jgi:hypothetical protein